MAGTIVVDRLESDASYASSINIASPVIVSNTFAFPAGSNTAPAITPSGDTNTGIFFPAADTIGFSGGGVEGFRLNSDGNLQLASGKSIVNSSGDAILNQSGSILQTVASHSITGGSNFNPGTIAVTLNNVKANSKVVGYWYTGQFSTTISYPNGFPYFSGGGVSTTFYIYPSTSGTVIIPFYDSNPNTGTNTYTLNTSVSSAWCGAGGYGYGYVFYEITG
jgi:hypothetical protein